MRIFRIVKTPLLFPPRRRLYIFFFLTVALASFFYFSYLVKKDYFKTLEEGEIFKRDLVGEKIGKMSLEQKVAQMMFIGADWEEWEEDGWQYGAGGIIISNPSAGRAGIKYQKSNILEDQITELRENVATRSGVVPFVGVDQEGGVVCRIPWLDCTGQREIQTPDQAFQLAQKRGEELKDLGINVVFAPVLDVAQSSNDFIWARTFDVQEEKKEELTASLGIAMIKGFGRIEGLITCPKHFPGHGGTLVDSHLHLPQIESDWQSFEKRIYPFKKAVEIGAEMMMAGHLKILNIKYQISKSEDEDRFDEFPASLSKKMITDVLRGELGFEGVVVTDDLLMLALKEYQESKRETAFEDDPDWWVTRSAVEAIQAGSDMVMVVGKPEIQEKVYKRLVEAGRNGEISQERLDESVKRIIKVKSSLAPSLVLEDTIR